MVKKEIKRLSNEELRERYIHNKKMDRLISLFYMIFFGALSVIIVSISISSKIYWLLSISVVSLVIFIISISGFSKLIEEIFVNRIIEGGEDAS